jgi:predicted NBD/HSP70 family sugar kinase
VARLAPAAGIDLPGAMAFADQLKAVQALMAKDDPRAQAIYQTIGVYLGYSIAWYARWYELRHLLVLGRVTSGSGGSVMIDTARAVLDDEFTELAKRIAITRRTSSSSATSRRSPRPACRGSRRRRRCHEAHQARGRSLRP